MRHLPLHAAYCAACVLVLTGVPNRVRAAPPPPAPAPAYVVEPTAAQRVKATLTVDLKAPKLQADEWSIYAAQLPQLPGQIDVRTTLIPHGKVVRELSDEARPVIYAEVLAGGARGRQSMTARLEYEATLLTRRLQRREPDAPAAPRVAPLDSKTRRLELASDRLFDAQTPEFQTWLNDQKLRPESAEDEIAFARRAFVALRQGFSHAEGANVEHVASKVCEAGKSDFIGLTALYIATLRANGIPARFLCGFPIISEGRPNTNYWTHAKSEFYAPGVGWVPADLAGAIRMNSPGDGLDYFGNDRADFLTVHLGTDLVVDTFFGRQSLEKLTDVWLLARGSGTLEGNQLKITLAVQIEPLDLAEVLAPPKPSRPGGAKPAAKTSRSKAKTEQ